MRTGGDGKLAETGRRVIGALVTQAEMPADGFGTRIKQKGGRPLRSGLGPVTLLRERKAEIVPGYPIGRVAMAARQPCSAVEKSPAS